MTEERIPAFVPGDDLVYAVCFTYPANIRAVTAAFRNETTGEEVSLWGEARLAPGGPRLLGTRTHVASLSYRGRETSGPLEPGRYRLARLEAETYRGKRLDFDNPPEDAFRFEDEPDESVVPQIARGPEALDPPTWFFLPEGHPNRPPHE